MLTDFFCRHLIIPNWYWTVVFVLGKWRHGSFRPLLWLSTSLSSTISFISLIFCASLKIAGATGLVSLEHPLSKSRLAYWITSDEKFNFFGKVMFIMNNPFFRRGTKSRSKNNSVTFKDLVEMIAKQIHADEKESKVGLARDVSLLSVRVPVVQFVSRFH